MWQLIVFLVFSGCVARVSPSPEEGAPASSISLSSSALTNKDPKQAYLHFITERLGVSAAELKKPDTVSFGFELGTHSAGTFPQVTFVHPELPAAKAGLREGDLLISLNGASLSSVGAHTLRLHLDHLAKSPVPLSMAVEREGRVYTFNFAGAPSYRFVPELIEDRSIVLEQQGRSLRISRSLLGELQGEHEIALLFSHLMAHDILAHRAGTVAKHLSGSLISAMLGTDRMPKHSFSESHEEQADRLALYITERAGYICPAPTEVWLRLCGTPENPRISPISQQHPLSVFRLVELESTARTIAELKRESKAIYPPPSSIF